MRVDCMNHYLKGIWGALVKNNGLKKIALTVVLLLVLALGLTLFIQPVKAFSVNVVSSSGYLDSVGGYHYTAKFRIWTLLP